MAAFAQATGLTAEVPHRRYLWTDAFAVCNYLELHRRTQADEYLDCALRLVDQVHHTLGRHRKDDPRNGWISGLGDENGERHPTAGGLRIGKKLDERKPGEAYDPRLEWDRDGQYFHYLTKWMQALNRVSRVTGDPVCRRWALELAETAHARFTYTPASGGPKRMYWKMSVDLSRPLVPSMGQHDPLDGYLTYLELQEATQAPQPDLQAEIQDMRAICADQRWATDDPLGLGGLLVDISRVVQLQAKDRHAERSERLSELLDTLLDDAAQSLAAYARTHDGTLQASRRLAFRELGLSIGLAAVERLPRLLADRPAGDAIAAVAARSARLAQYMPLRSDINTFWLDPQHRATSSWQAHSDINTVMLATSLAPDTYLQV